MKIEIKLESPIFETQNIRNAVRATVKESAKEYKDETRKRMIYGATRTGVLDARRRNNTKDGFVRYIRRSRRGERPAVETGNLANSIQDKDQGEFTVVVDVAPNPNPETGALANIYAAILQLKLDRKIMTPEDEQEAQIKMNARAAKKLAQLT